MEDIVVGRLFDKILAVVAAGQYVVGQHAAERLEERGVLEWQVVDGISSAGLISERPGSAPSPSVELMEVLADGTEVKVIWSYLASADVAKLVTVHFIDE